VEIHIYHPINGIKIEVVDPDEGLDDASHIDESIRQAQSLLHLCRKRYYLLAVGDVDGECLETTGLFASERLGLIEPVRFDIESSDRCAARQEIKRYFSPNPVTSSCDDKYFARDFDGEPPRRQSMGANSHN
jgi:hypothetical protein